LAGRLPDSWFTEVEVLTDRDEILILGAITPPQEASPDAVAGRVKRFREETRAARIEIASELESSTGRKVSWGVRCADTTELFTRLAVPVMTRLAMPQRHLLDTLVEAGVARSRSDALAWCVRLVGQHEGDWLADLDRAMGDVRTVRDRGPSV
jgi:hypothetical protein